ncbi:unnamed protein product [Prorocentrum cordatum]|uniref:Uncharacterized protein n=1 Tax=Prorocentrum cordatum TaxID=2364126 RepID=A0ABN9XXH7_9DINO|nr:unnamed protein product [Polarella glacialis]
MVIAFVGYGQQHRSLVDDMAHEVAADGGEVSLYGARRALTEDHSRTIGHQENSNAAQTQRTVIRQEGCEQVCKNIVDAVWNVQKQQILVLVRHECAPAQRDVEHLMSRNTVEGQYMRAHSSKIFNLGEQRGKRGHIAMLKNVMKWLQPGKARGLTDGGEQPYSQLYACKAVTDTFEACATWKTLWD